MSIPLVLDLDGTLLATDSLHESLFLFLKRETYNSWKIPLWAIEGRSVVKERLAHVLDEDDIERLPINQALTQFAQRESDLGREIVLATAANRQIAEKVSRRFGFISRIIASDVHTNLKGKEKAGLLEKMYPEGFIYAGDSHSDLHVWDKSQGGVVIGGRRIVDKAGVVTKIYASFSPLKLNFKSLRRGLRLHQWIKNTLIFVPIVLGGKAYDPLAWTQASEAFVALSLLASSTYIFNDLWDLQEDRAHWSKKYRPIASGQFSIIFSISLAALLGLTSVAISMFLGWPCLVMLALYLTVSLCYSLKFKKEPIIDVFLLACLFTMRIAIGNVVTGIAFSPWLMIFSMSIFLSLSLAKRQTEIARMIEHGQEVTRGRGYRASDAPFVLATGVSSMIAAVLIMVIYLIEDAFPKGVYNHPEMLWGMVAIIFLWLARIWLLCHRGVLHDDPVAFALKDRLSLFYAGIVSLIFIAALI